MSIVLLGSTSGSVTLQEPAVAGTTVIDLPATSGTMAVTGGSPSFTNITATGTLTVNGNTTLGDASTDTILMTGAPSIGGAGLGMGMGFRNRIINGAMVIDQRNAGASVSVSNATLVYGADRFLVYEDTSATSCTVQQVSDAPANFTNSLKFTVGTGGSASASQLAVLESRIEGYNFADFAFGTANAKAFTLSFWVKATATGTYCVAFRNASDNRSYVATYTVNATGTWEQKTITVTGDTSGTWGTTNGIGISVRFDMGSGSTYQTSTLNTWQAGLYFSNSAQVNIIGTSSASLQITGVQLEKGSTATSFDYRPYGTELQLCQRYLPAYQAVTVAGQALSTTTARFILPLPVTTRAYVSGLTNTISVGDIYVYTGGYAGAFNITAIAIAPGYLIWNNSAAFDVTIGTASFTAGALVAINFNPNTNKALVFTGAEL